MNDRLSTNQLAEKLGMLSKSIRVHMRRNGGAYCGIRPIKALNGRLLWPADTAERVLNGIRDQGEKAGDA